MFCDVTLAPEWFGAAASARQAERTGRRGDRDRQHRAASQVAVRSRCRRPALGDRPYDQRLPAPHVTRYEHAGYDGGIAVIPADIPPLVQPEPEPVEKLTRFGSAEPHGQQDQVAGELPLGSRHWNEPASGRRRVDQPERPDPAGPVGQELLGGDRENTLAALLVWNEPASGRRRVD